MSIEMRTPEIDELSAPLEALETWQFDGAPFQLHPGDVGWFWRNGAEATAAALRTWSRGGQMLAVGLLDETDLLRLAIAPDAHTDAELAQRVLDDVNDPERGVLSSASISLELTRDVLMHDLLDEAGWSWTERWSVMRHDLISVEEHGLRIELVGPEQAPTWAHVHGAAWGGKPSDEEAILGRWQQLATGLPFANAQCLIGYDQQDNPVATLIVWSSGPGRHGIIEPMGVSAEHRGKGHGRAMNLAGAAALRDMGCSSAYVATTSSNVGAVATYEAAGFEKLYERLDRTREALPAAGAATA